MNPAAYHPLVQRASEQQESGIQPSTQAPAMDRDRADHLDEIASPGGLTELEAQRRHGQGEANNVSFAPSRSYGRIVRDNAFLSINVIIFATGVALVLLGLINDALLTVGLVLLNVLIAVIQEVRAKRALDQIALLNRMQAGVMRDGVERRIDPAAIVLGDLLLARPGDQIMADGVIVSAVDVDIDESLLTGEAAPVARGPGDAVYSGSFVVSGTLSFVAEQVGVSSLANRLTAQAREFRPHKTPLQREIDLVLRLMVVLILVLGGPIVLDLVIRGLGIAMDYVESPLADQLARAYQGYSLKESVQTAAVVVGLVPQGLALMLTVSYALGAVRLANKGLLLQQANAVESLSHVDVVCFDKTGTLTTNQLVVDELHPIGVSKSELAKALGDYATNISSPNPTIDAMVTRFSGRSRTVRKETPFASVRKWSALTFADEDATTWVLGAPDVLAAVMPASEGFETTLKRWAGQGLRVLMLARAAGTLPLDSDSPMLPRNLEPLGLVAFSDGLQPDVSRVLSRFSGIGVSLRIISGDYPETVAALARRVGFGQYHDLQLVSGLDLARMSETERKMAVEDGHIFGRVSPDQKVEIIQILQRQGHYVAMIGDGVNDVLALKQAHVGIAMEKGSQACRRVADVVLLGNGLGILPAALNEGQRIVRASQDLLKLFLSRSLSLAVAILGIGVLGFAFPALPTHTAIPALLVIGIPTLALAAWAQPVQATGSSLRTALPFAIPAALSIGAVEGVIYVSYMRVTGDIMLARTIFTLVATLCGLVLILFLAPPSPFWTGISPLRGDRRITALALTMLALLALIMGLPAGREFLGFASLQPINLAIAVLAVTAWGLGLRTIWRRDLPRRWLGINVSPVSAGGPQAPIQRVVDS